MIKRTLPVLVFVGLLTALSVRAFLEEPVQIEKLQQLRKGMTKDEVHMILGAPAEIYEGGQWTYKKTLVFGYLSIHWDCNGKYDGEYNYEEF